MRYNSQCILVFSSTTIIPKKRAHARFCVIETVFLNYLFVTAPIFYKSKPSLKALPTFSPKTRYVLLTISKAIISILSTSILPFSSK